MKLMIIVFVVGVVLGGSVSWYINAKYRKSYELLLKTKTKVSELEDKNKRLENNLSYQKDKNTLLLRTLKNERQSRTDLEATKAKITATNTKQVKQIQEIKRNDQEANNWSSTPVPVSVASVLEHRSETISGADSYQSCVSESNAVCTDSNNSTYE